MSEKVELIRNPNGFVLWGDSRDIVTDYEQREKVWAWCEEQGITVEHQGTLARKDVWRVRDDKQRMWFKLRWS